MSVIDESAWRGGVAQSNCHLGTERILQKMAHAVGRPVVPFDRALGHGDGDPRVGPGTGRPRHTIAVAAVQGTVRVVGVDGHRWSHIRGQAMTTGSFTRC